MTNLLKVSLVLLAVAVAGCTHDGLAVGRVGDASAADGAGDASLLDASPAQDLATGADAPAPMPPTLPAPMGGSRLKVGHHEAREGGAAGGFFWQDTGLHTTCFWLPGPDGKYRCVPGGAVSDREILFADPQCARAAISWFSDDPLAAITMTVGSTCPASYAVRLVSAKLAQGSYYRRSTRSGACITDAYPLEPGDALYALGDDSPTALVSAVRRLGAAVDGLAPVFLDAEDGSSLFLAWHDVARGLDCYGGIGADGKRHCLPSPAAYFTAEPSAYADEGCIEPAASGAPSSCDLQAVVLAKSGSGCAPRTTIYGAKMRSSQAYLGGGGSCGLASGPPADYFAAGPEIPAASLPAAAAGGFGEGRLQVKTQTTSAGTVRTGLFWDTQLGMDCGPLLATDGSWRCVPFPRLLIGYTRLFADPACTRPVLDREPSWCSQSFVGISGVNGTATNGYHLFRSEGAHPGPVYTKRTDGCIATPRPSTEAIFMLSDELPPSAFGELERVP